MQSGNSKMIENFILKLKDISYDKPLNLGYKSVKALLTTSQNSTDPLALLAVENAKQVLQIDAMELLIQEILQTYENGDLVNSHKVVDIANFLGFSEGEIQCLAQEFIKRNRNLIKKKFN